MNQLAKFKIYASNDPTTFNSEANLCHVSAREGSGRGNWMRLLCKKVFTSRYVFVQADRKSDNSNQVLTVCEMKVYTYWRLAELPKRFNWRPTCKFEPKMMDFFGFFNCKKVTTPECCTCRQWHRVFMSSEMGYQCYCSHMTTRKSDKIHIVVVECERTLGVVSHLSVFLTLPDSFN